MSKKMETALSTLLAPTEQRIQEGAEYLRDQAKEVFAKIEAYIVAVSDLADGSQYVVDENIEALLGVPMFEILRREQEARRHLLSFRRGADWAQLTDSTPVVARMEAPAAEGLRMSYVRANGAPAARVVRDRRLTPVVSNPAEDNGILYLTGHLVHHWPALCAAACRVSETAGWDAKRLVKFQNTIKGTHSYDEAIEVIKKAGIILRSEA